MNLHLDEKWAILMSDKCRSYYAYEDFFNVVFLWKHNVNIKTLLEITQIYAFLRGKSYMCLTLP